MPRARQAALFVDQSERLWAILEKVRGAGILEAAELALLEETLRASASSRPSDLKNLIAVWRTEYARACGGAAPRLTDTEAHALRTLVKRVGGIDRACELVRAFWPWREQLDRQGAAVPAPHPLALAKHCATVAEFAAKRAPQKKPQAAEDIRRAQEEAQANPVPIEAVKAFGRQLRGIATDKALTAEPRDAEKRREQAEAATAARRLELDQQADELRRRDRGLGR